MASARASASGAMRARTPSKSGPRVAGLDAGAADDEVHHRELAWR
jgi:hypothetical protein